MASIPHGQEWERESQWIARLRSGDETAFAELVRTYGGRMLAVAKRLLRSEDTAHDAVQDAFLSAYRNLGQFQGEARLGTWLHRIVVNAALMKLRSQRRRPESPLEDLLPAFGPEGHHVVEPASYTVPADRLIEQKETRALVRAAIAELPETHRTVLLLRDIEELSTEETARALGITANAAKIRLHRARQALATVLGRRLGRARPGRARAASAGTPGRTGPRPAPARILPPAIDPPSLTARPAAAL